MTRFAFSGLSIPDFYSCHIQASREIEVVGQMSETALLQRLMLHFSTSGMRLFRNQTGTYQLPDGRWISSGLCVGSSDLIGWVPIVVTEAMVGRALAVFVAVEGKVGTRKATPEQARFIAAVQAAGGLAVVARSDEDVSEALARFTA